MGKNEKIAILIVFIVVIFVVVIRDRQGLDNTNKNVEKNQLMQANK